MVLLVLVLVIELQAMLQLLLLLQGEQFAIRWDPIVALVSDLTIDADTSAAPTDNCN